MTVIAISTERINARLGQLEDDVATQSARIEAHEATIDRIDDNLELLKVSVGQLVRQADALVRIEETLRRVSVHLLRNGIVAKVQR